MKVLIINGSPKGKTSNSFQLTQSFLEGLQEETELETEILEVERMDLQGCRGCFACWNRTPGVCVLEDGMKQVLPKLVEADLIVWSFPLYYFGLPGTLKRFLDRQLPLSLPFMASGSAGSHDGRYDRSHQKHVLISTCGFYTAKGNYDAVLAQFDRLLGKGNYTTIFCGQGELFRVPELKERTSAYLETVKTAGKEYAKGTVRKETAARLKELLYPRNVFEAMADASWGVSKPDSSDTAPKNSEALTFTRQMAALYNPSSWEKDRVVEFFYPDVNERIQIVLQKDGYKVLNEDLIGWTTQIETDLSLWKAIARGEVDGQQAMMEHRYSVHGDFDLMIHWSDFFGGSQETERKESKTTSIKETSMLLFLAPWIVFWAAVSIQPVTGALAALMVPAVLSLAYLKYKMVIFEPLSDILVSLFCLLLLAGMPLDWLLPLSYAAFGLLWLATVFQKIPLSAWYSQNDYGKEKILHNPLFLRTNRIITAGWGILYLVQALFSFGLLQSPLAGYTSMLSYILPILMGVFTLWFQKWYPAHFAASM